MARYCLQIIMVKDEKLATGEEDLLALAQEYLHNFGRLYQKGKSDPAAKLPILYALLSGALLEDLHAKILLTSGNQEEDRIGITINNQSVEKEDHPRAAAFMDSVFLALRQSLIIERKYRGENYETLLSHELEKEHLSYHFKSAVKATFSTIITEENWSVSEKTRTQLARSMEFLQNVFSSYPHPKKVENPIIFYAMEDFAGSFQMDLMSPSPAGIFAREQPVEDLRFALPREISPGFSWTPSSREMTTKKESKSRRRGRFEGRMDPKGGRQTKKK